MCSSVSYNSFTILTPCAAINKEKPSEINRFQRVLVRVARLERAASTSQMSRATNCTTPGYLVVMIIARNSCDSKFFPVCGHLCGQSGFWPGFAARKNPANARVARRSVLWLFLSWIDGESLPNTARRFSIHHTRSHRTDIIIIYAGKDCKTPFKYGMMLSAR